MAAATDASREAILEVTGSATSETDGWESPSQERQRGQVCLVFADFFLVLLGLPSRPIAESEVPVQWLPR